MKYVVLNISDIFSGVVENETSDISWVPGGTILEISDSVFDDLLVSSTNNKMKWTGSEFVVSDLFVDKKQQKINSLNNLYLSKNTFSINTHDFNLDEIQRITLYTKCLMLATTDCATVDNIKLTISGNTNIAKVRTQNLKTILENVECFYASNQSVYESKLNDIINILDEPTLDAYDITTDWPTKYTEVINSLYFQLISTIGI